MLGFFKSMREREAMLKEARELKNKMIDDAKVEAKDHEKIPQVLSCLW